MEVFIKPNGIQQGPFTKDELKKMMDEGKVGRMVLAFHEGLSNWMPLAAVLAPREQPPPFRGLPAADQPPESASPVDTQTVVGPRASPSPEPNPPQDEFMAQRGRFEENLAAKFRELKQGDWKSAFPLDSVFKDKPWNLVWVRWLLLFALVPGLVKILASDSDGANSRANLGVVAYVALLWVFGLRILLKPDRITLAGLVLPTFAPLMVQTGLHLIAGRTHALDGIFAATEGGSWVSKPLATLAIAAIAQIFVAAPQLLKCRTQPVTARDMLFAGSIAGLAMGIAPTLAHFIGHRWFDSFRWTALGAFRSQQLIGLISWMVVSGLMCGMLGFVIQAAAAKPKSSWPVAISGIFASSLLMTAYHLTSGRWLGLVVVVITTVLFATYVRHTDRRSSNWTS